MNTSVFTEVLSFIVMCLLNQIKSNSFSYLNTNLAKGAILALLSVKVFPFTE